MKPLMKRTTFSLLSLGILLSGLIALTVLVGTRQEIRKQAASEDYVSVLGLSTIGTGGNSFTIAPGSTFEVRIELTPNQPLSAVDVVLDFDKGLLTLENIVPNTSSNLQTFVPIDTGGTFQKDTIITTANSEGVVRFGAVTFDYANEQTTDPQGLPIDPLATLTFRAKAAAQGTAIIEFGTHGFTAEGATTDSNAVAYVEPGASTAVVDILAQPTTRVQATISLGIGLSTNLLPEAIDDSCLEIPIRVRITKQGDTDPAFNQEALFTRSSSATTFAAEVNFEGPPGTYTVYVKGPLHLSLSAETSLTAEGANQLDFTSQGPLLGGDLNGDDAVGLGDITMLIIEYDGNSPTADINFDGVVGLADIATLIINYDKIGHDL